MDYDMTGNPNTIYVDANTTSSTFIIIAVFSVFLFLAVWNGINFLRRRRALRQSYPGFSLDAKTKRQAIVAVACLIASLACLVVYAVNPNYEADQAQQGATAVRAVQDRFGLDAHWEFAPYNPFDDQNDLLGNLYIDEGGQTYPTRITPATYQARSDGEEVTKSGNETFVIEVRTNSGYVPISDFAKQHGVRPRY